MSARHYYFAVSLLMISCIAQAQSVMGPLVRVRTSVGDIDVLLLPASAPLTVANFLKYVNKGAYNNSVFHRSLPNFIVQTGGYQYVNGSVSETPPDPPVKNEYSLSNVRGTLAMAKGPNDPNSATNQWFFNLQNNAANLNSQNGGFTVFGRVNDAAGLTIMDRIAAQKIYNFGSPFDSLPLVNYNGSATPTESNFVLIRSIIQIEAARSISAGAFGANAAAAPGSFIEIYGSNLAQTTRSWAEGDFKDRNAPTTLDDVTVSIGGQTAFVSYVSPTQVNVQVPALTPITASSPVTVSYKGVPVATSSIAIRTTAPALLAPEAFKAGDKQYVYAVRADGSVVGNGSISGVSTAPATPGETIVLYGIGFGPVSPNTTSLAGKIVNESNSLTTPPEFTLDGKRMDVAYAGLVSGLVGLYQFNLVVPADAGTGDLELKVTAGVQSLQQTLYVPVR